MKVAIVHELLTVRGGAERVALCLADMYPDAEIFTLLYDESKLGDWFPRYRIHASRLQPFAALTKQFNHHLYLPFFRGAVEAWDFSSYDLVVSSSSSFIHGLRVPPGTPHVCYVHTPARYLWDQTLAVQERMSTPVRALASRLFHRLRTWDASVADRPTTLVAASDAVKRRIELYWGRHSEVVHPFADNEWFALPPKHTPVAAGPFVTVANLRGYKFLERAVEACIRVGVPLRVIGDGPARGALEQLAKGGDVVFPGRLEGNMLRDELLAARALIIPGIEDFGINAVEALACGTPVITVRGGGTEEIIDSTTGITCNPDAAGIETAVRSLNSFGPGACRSRAERFTQAQFEQQMYSVIEAAVSATANASR